MTMTASEPQEPTLEDRAGEQHRNGWGPIPLPTARKAPPPDGFTGQKNPRPSFADWWTVVQENPDRWGNLGARIPIGVVGIDLDAYNGKNGLETWKALGGSEFPETVVLSSRFGPGYDGASGIRFYRLPDEVEQTSLWGAHDGIEILRYGHRYAVSPGSTHPEGGVYRLVDMRSKQFLDVLPHILDLPELPLHLALRLTEAGAPWAGDAPVDREPDTAPPCRYTMTLLTRALSDFKNTSSRFDTMRDAVWALISGEDEGHHLGIALDTLGLAYIAATKADREAQHAEPPGSEFARAVAGARAKVDANPTDEMFRACCLSADEPVTLPEDTLAGATTDTDRLELQQEAVEPTPYDRAVRARFAELRVNEDAKNLLAVHKVGEIAPVEPIGLTDFLAQPDEEIAYRVEGLWPREGRVLLAAAAKSGKTTLVTANLIPSLVDGRPFLGRHAVEPVAGTVVLFNMEVGEPVLRRWLRGSGIHRPSKVVVVNLRGKASTLTLSTDKGRTRIADMLLAVNAEVVILDPLAPVLASLGLDENSNADVATFFSWWSEVMGAAGVRDDMVVHHTGHAGQRSRGASRLLDEPDAVWTLTRDKDDEDELEGLFDAPMRYLSAYGRDVEMRTEGLDYEPDTHRLTLNGQEKGKTGDRYERRVLDLMSDGLPRSQNAIVETCTGAPRSLWPAVKALIARGALEDTGATGKGGGSLYVLAQK